MHDPDPPFRPIRRREGYLPLADLGLVGDGTTAALVGLDGHVGCERTWSPVAVRGRARASPLGLLSEQINPSTGEFMGNFPQAFSHIGIIAGGVNLARARAGARA